MMGPDEDVTYWLFVPLEEVSQRFLLVLLSKSHDSGWSSAISTNSSLRILLDKFSGIGIIAASTIFGD